MFKVNDDYDGMIAAAVQGTKSEDVAKIIEFIQKKYVVPTNFEKVNTLFVGCFVSRY